MTVFLRWFPLCLVLLGVGLAGWLMTGKPQLCAVAEGGASPTAVTSVAAPSTRFSVLGKAPDWSRLDAWQRTISRRHFEQLVTRTFVTGTRWREWIEIREDEALIHTGEQGVYFRLHFAREGLESPAPRAWRKPEELPVPPQGKPLSGLHIAIDPGHIGGEWAKIEERWLVSGDNPPIQEGDMTLRVARMVQPRLEALGARVSLVRESLEPVTSLRPAALEGLAADAGPPDSSASLRKLAERLFYRTAEIRARAKVVNEILKPDLVLCLHFNAEPWGDAQNPQWVRRSHFHLLLNGAYTDEEVALADQRFAMIEKILSRTHEEEVRVGTTISAVFVQHTGLPPFEYPRNAPNARPIDGQPYLWARNLLANRLYECPVIFYEPYVMNSALDYPRLVAGDYEGERMIDGKKVRSIFREYADAVVDGLCRHYENRRK
jgi:N-acetylmuramoyl-L-alanine amidase